MSHFDDPEAVARYREGPPRMVPGFHDLHKLTDLLLAERAPEDAKVLVLGAGGGLELEYLAKQHDAWTFDGVDPSAEMLKLAAQTTSASSERIALHEGYIDTAPDGPFDAAVCLLTLHFIPREERLQTLEQLHRRLAPGAPLVVMHHSVDDDIWLQRYATYAGNPGMATALRERLPLLTPAEDEQLLSDAGFKDAKLFYAALTFRGWVAHA